MPPPDHHSRSARRLSVRLRVTVILLALLAVVSLPAAACSDDGAGEDGSSQESGTDGTGEDGAADEGAAERLAAAEEVYEEGRRIVEEAEDICDAQEGMMSLAIAEPPESAAEVEAYVSFLVDMSTGAADLVQDEANAEALRRGAQELADYAEGRDYDPAMLDETELPIESADEYEMALSSLFIECAEAAPQDAPAP